MQDGSEGVRSARGAGGASYRFPRRFIVRWVLSLLCGRRRVLWRDGQELLDRRPPGAVGLDRLPRNGRFILIMNHYERTGLRVWWPAFAVSTLLGPPDLRWIITNRFYRYRLCGRIRIPDRLMGWALGLVARVYGLIPVERAPAGAMRRAIALRRMRRSLEGPTPRPVATTPEGEYGAGCALGAPYPTAGKALAWLSRGQIPIVPAAVTEEDDHIMVQIGVPFFLEWHGLADARRRREELAARVMGALASVLPPAQRGRWEPRESSVEGPVDGGRAEEQG